MGIRYNIDRYMSTHEDWRYLTQVLCDNQPYENSSSQMIIHNPSTTHNLNYYYNGQAGNWNIDFNADGLWSPTKEIQNTTEIINEHNENHINTLNETTTRFMLPSWYSHILCGKGTYRSEVNTLIPSAPTFISIRKVSLPMTTAR